MQAGGRKERPLPGSGGAKQGGGAAASSAGWIESAEVRQGRREGGLRHCTGKVQAAGRPLRAGTGVVCRYCAQNRTRTRAFLPTGTHLGDVRGVGGAEEGVSLSNEPVHAGRALAQHGGMVGVGRQPAQPVGQHLLQAQDGGVDPVPPVLQAAGRGGSMRSGRALGGRRGRARRTELRDPLARRQLTLNCEAASWWLLQTTHPHTPPHPRTPP